MNWEERGKKLVENHWDYHEILLDVISPMRKDRENLKMLYLEIGKHFYKHAIEDVREGKIKISTNCS